MFIYWIFPLFGNLFRSASSIRDKNINIFQTLFIYLPQTCLHRALFQVFFCSKGRFGAIYTFWRVLEPLSKFVCTLCAVKLMNRFSFSKKIEGLQKPFILFKLWICRRILLVTCPQISLTPYIVTLQQLLWFLKEGLHSIPLKTDFESCCFPNYLSMFTMTILHANK